MILETKEEIKNSIRFIRLATGEDILASVVYVRMGDSEHNDDEYDLFVVNPMKLMYLVSEDRQSLVISVVEWVLSSIVDDQKFQLEPSQILAMSAPSDNLIERYIAATEVKFDQDAAKHQETSAEDQAKWDALKEKFNFSEDLHYSRKKH